MTLVVRTAGEPASVLGAIRREVSALNPSMPIHTAETMEAIIGKSVSVPRFRTLLLSAFAALALLLAAIGIYGVISFSITQRTREIGVRMALGARAQDVHAMVIAQGIRPVFTGVVIGLLASLAGTRILKSLLFGVSATDPGTFVVVPLLLGAVALIACWLPARRATRVNPIAALSSE
jgi:putative ABC transport system permease protein